MWVFFLLMQPNASSDVQEERLEGMLIVGRVGSGDSGEDSGELSVAK